MRFRSQSIVVGVAASRNAQFARFGVPVPVLYVYLFVSFMVVAIGCDAGKPRQRPSFRTGLEVLAAADFAALQGKRVGVVTNHTGVDRELVSTIDRLHRASGVELGAIFGPEHGARGDAQAGDAVGDGIDERTGVRMYSLYGERRRPSAASLAGLDAVLFDIQDIGVRTYTYLSTLVEVLGAAAESGVEVWVLDRPVPIGAEQVQGPLLEPGFESFVGAHTIPLRHGLTAGEFARMVNEEREFGASLRIVEMEGYRREMSFRDTELPWVATSPNIPTVDTALLYSGTVLIEGTNLSEGRGTTRPFHLVGAPWLDASELARRLAATGLQGVRFRPTRFTPTFSKYRGESCAGVEIHVVAPNVANPFRATVALLLHVRAMHPSELSWRAEFFDKLAGSTALREAIERGDPLERIVARSERPIAEYLERRKRFLLYENSALGL